MSEPEYTKIMSRNTMYSLPLAIILALLLSLINSGNVFAQSATIMPMGDSITVGVRGQCGYRRVLTQNILNDPSCNATFVGPLITSSGDASRENCSRFDTNHAGVSGRRADEFTDGRISNWSNAYNPEYYLVHIGSNDIFQGESIDEIMNDIDLVRSRIAARSPNAVMLLANVIPWDPQSPDASFGSFDHPDIDELAMSAELSSAINFYVDGLDSSSVRLVDVRSGFNNTIMTIDGVHPNDLGEAHVALRFQQALEDVGVCDVSTLPTLTMARNQWYQLSLPANPNSFNRVRDIFDNLPADRYGSGPQAVWRLFSWNPNQATSERVYTDPGIDGILSQGRAYWAIQTISSAVEINMPLGSTLTPLDDSSQCTSSAGCYSVAITPQSTPITDPGIGAYDWDMVGYPHFQATRFSDTRVTTPAAGPCSGSSGCTPTQAAVNLVMGNPIYKWNGQIDDYDRVSGDLEMLPWDGFWIPVLSQGANGNSRWVTVPD